MRHARRDGAAEARDADLLQQFLRRLPQARDALGRLPEAEAVRLARLHRQRDIAERGKAIEDAGDLERARKPEPRPLRCRQCGDIAAVEQDAPGVWREFAGELADQRGLSGAVRADERVGLALADRERHVVGGVQRAERLVQMFDLKQRLAHGPAPTLSAALISVSAKSNFGAARSPAPVMRSTRAPDAVLHQQHARDQKRAEEQHPVLGVVGNHVAKGEEERRADDRTDQRIGGAEDHHGEHFAGMLPAQHRGADELRVVRHQRAGEPGDAAGDDEDDELVRIGRKADRRGAPLVVADAADHHAELRAHDAVRNPQDEDEQHKYDVVERAVIGERKSAERIALRHA